MSCILETSIASIDCSGSNMRTVNAHEAKTQLPKVIEAVKAGEDVIIAHAERPTARLTHLESSVPRRTLGRLTGKISIPADSDALLPSDVLTLFEKCK